MFSQVQQESMSSAAATFTAVQFDTLPHPSTFDVVEDQEGGLRFPATCAGTPVGRDGRHAQISIPVSTLLVTSYTAFISILQYLVRVGSVVDPLKLSLAGTAACAIGRKVLGWLALSATGTVPHVGKLTYREAWQRALEIERG